MQVHGARDGMGPTRATGKGVGVAVLDSGISPHPDLDDRAVAAVSTIPDSPGVCDFLGHGTHVSSLVLGSGKASQGRFQGVAPGAHLISIRVTAGDETEMTPADRYHALLSGLNWAIENRERYNIRVANLSVGYPLISGGHQQYLFDPLGRAIEEATRQGIVLVVAAGNQGNRPGSMCLTPATHPDVITVGSTDETGGVADFSARGPSPGKGHPDLLAPGTHLMGANVAHSRAEQQNDLALRWSHRLRRASDQELKECARELLAIHGDAPQLLNRPDLREELLRRLDVKATDGFLPNGHPAYLALEGTSMSAPLVAGVVACMLEVNPALRPQEVKAILKATARHLPGVDINAQGAGVLDASAAIAEASRRASKA